VKKVMEGDSSV